MSTTGPLPILILPDGLLTGRDNVVSVTSEDGPFCAPAVAGTSNYGDLIPSLTSVRLSTNYLLDLKIQRAGGVYSLAEWIQKGQGDAETSWQGVDEVRYVNNPHDPFSPIGESHPVSTAVSTMAAVYASQLGKIFLYLIGGSNSIVYVRYRNVGDEAHTWTLATINLGSSAIKSVAGGIEVLEMPDGTLRMLVVSGTAGATDNDVSVYGSTDGLTWTKIARDVLSKGYGDSMNVLRMRAAVSGDWVRMVVMDNSGPTLRTLYSSDRCASFTWLESSDLTGVGVAPESNGFAIDPYGHIDVEGVGDASGTFILVYMAGANTSLKASVGGRNADWSEATVVVSAVGDIFSACVVNDGTRMYYVTATKVPGAGNPIRLEAEFVPLDQATDLAQATNTKFSPWLTTARYMPAYLTGVKADPGFAILWGLTDPDAGTPGTAVTGNSALVYGRQWTARSLWRNEMEQLPVADEFLTQRWDSAVGPPNRAASLTTPFAYHAGVSASSDWLADRYRIGSDGTGANGAIYWAHNEGATGSWLSDLSYFGWIIGALTTTIGGVSDDRCAVRLRALGTLTAGIAGATYDLSVRHGTTQVVVYDNNASAALATFSVNLAAKFYQVRLGFGVSGTTQLEVAVAPMANLDDATAWSSATVTPTSAVGATFQGYEWGHLVGQSGLSSYWRRIEHDESSNCNQFGFLNPTKLRGAPVAAQPIYTTTSVYTAWSGGAGFEGDEWTAEPRHQNEVENLFLPSPDAAWIGTSLTTQTIVLRASSTDAAELFDHDAFAILGTSTHRLTVEYNDTDFWGAPAYSAAVTNDLVRPLRVVTAAGNLVKIDTTELTGGEYVGKFARTVLSGLNVMSFRIVRQKGEYLYLDPVGSTTGESAFAAGSSLWIHDDKFVVEHPAGQRYQFMRLTFPCPPGTTTATLDVRAGTLLAGMTVGFPAAINWTHTQREEPNVELSEGFQGLRWGYQLGEARKGVEGKIVGDTVNARRILANQLRNLTQFSVRPLIFAWDKDDLQRSSMYVRYTGTVEHEESGWKQAADGSWYPVGDLTLVFSEEK